MVVGWNVCLGGDGLGWVMMGGDYGRLFGIVVFGRLVVVSGGGWWWMVMDGGER